MKKCEYCGGNAESGCGAVETAAGLYLHYSKIECAEVLKLQVREMGDHAARLRVCLLRYGNHYDRCAVFPRPSGKDCDCGFEANVQAVPGQVTEEAKTEKRELPVKNVEFFVEPCPKDWDGSPKGCWDPHPLTREICQLKPDGHKTHKRDDTTGKQFLCWVRT